MLWNELSAFEQEATKGLLLLQVASVGLSFADVDMELPQMYEILHNAGFPDPIQPILEAIDGMKKKGVYEYVVEQLYKVVAPTLDPIKNMETWKQALIGHSVGDHFEGGHFNADLLDMHNAIKDLLVGGSFAGAAAMTLQRTDEKLYNYNLDLGNRMSYSIDVDNKLLDQIDEIIQWEATGLIVLGAIIVFMVVIVALATSEIGGIGGFFVFLLGLGLLGVEVFALGMQQKIIQAFQTWITEQENQLRAIPAIPDVLTANE